MVPRRFALPAAIAIVLIFALVDQSAHRELFLWKYLVMGVAASELAIVLGDRLTTPIATVALGLGGLLLYLDFLGPNYDWFGRLGIVKTLSPTYTFGLGVACMIILIGLSRPTPASPVLSIQPLRILGAISYSIFLFHPIFIWANFPEFVISDPGKHTGKYDHYMQPPWYYMPLLYVPGILFWSLLAYLVAERPFLLKMQRLTASRN
jgi:peptidoglycan/LPS O-acetylase OafA/YrhL